jgi:hypothetical protein
VSFHDDMMDKVDLIAEYAARPNIFSSDMMGALYAEANIGLWRSQFGQFTKADPESAGELVTDLTTAGTNLNVNNEGTLDSISTEVHEWTGRAADGFRDYVGEVKDAVSLQVDAIKALSMLAEAHQKMLQAVREDLERIADNTIVALRTSSGGGGGGLSFGFAVLAAAAYVLSAGTAAPVMWAVVAGFASVASSATATATIEGQSQVEKLQSMEQALGDLREATLQEQARIQAGLKAMLDFFEVNIAEIRPRRPPIATPMSLTPTDKGWTTADFYPTPG